MTNQPHILIDEKINTNVCIMPGDPGRVDVIGGYLSDVENLAYNREYKSIIGTYNGKRILAISSGIGGPSTTIAVEELKEIGIDTIIRVGSCGACQKNINLGDLIIAVGSVRDDGASASYIESIFPAVPDHRLLNSLVTHCGELGFRNHIGLIRSVDTYYSDKAAERNLYWSKYGILGEDCESATLFVIGRIRGLKTASILNNVVVFGNDPKEGIGDYVSSEPLRKEGERKEIILALTTLSEF